VARLPYRQPDEATGRVREALEAAPALNIFRLLAHADSAFVPWLRWGGVLLSDLELDPALRELAILRVARLTPGAEYEWVQHAPIATAVGATDEQVAALERDDATGECFSATERAALRFTEEVVMNSRVSDDTFAAIAEQLPPRQIVELLMVIGNYMLVGRVMASLEIDLDEPVGAAALRVARESSAEKR
jgi:4-carboxymuconolactone decarboxylase